MGTTTPAFDSLVEDVTGETPHHAHPEPVEVRVIHAVRTETLPPRTILTDQVTAGTVPVRLVGEQTSRQSVVVMPSADVFIGGPGVTTGTGFLVKANAPLTLCTTDALYVVASGAATVYTLTTLHEG